MATIKILGGGYPKQTAKYDGNLLVLKDNKKKLRHLVSAACIRNLEKVSEEKRRVTFKLTLTDHTELMASSSHKIYEQLLADQFTTMSNGEPPQELKENKKMYYTQVGLICLGGLFMMYACTIDTPDTSYSPAYEFQFTEEMRPAAKSKGDNPMMAFTMCKKFIKDSLNDPASAKFGYYENGNVHFSNGLYVVSNTVNAKNAFGGRLNKPYRCTVKEFPANDTWSLVDLSGL